MNNISASNKVIEWRLRENRVEYRVAWERMEENWAKGNALKYTNVNKWIDLGIHVRFFGLSVLICFVLTFLHWGGASSTVGISVQTGVQCAHLHQEGVVQSFPTFKSRCGVGAREKRRRFHRKS